MELIYKTESYKIMGACFEVYKQMGCGFLEAVYQECLELELAAQNIPFKSQAELSMSYKGQQLNKNFVPDFVCYDKIIVEIKAIRSIEDWERAQVLNYLKVSSHKLGLLVNFGHYPELEHERLVR